MWMAPMRWTLPAVCPCAPCGPATKPTARMAASAARRSALEPEVDGGEAELGATEDESGLLRIVAGVGPDGVDVAPRPLDRIVQEDAAAAAGLEQPIDGAHAPVGGLGDVPAVTRPVLQRNLLAAGDHSHHLAEVAEQPVTRGADLGRRFGQ